MEKIHFSFLGLELVEPMSLLLNWVMMVQCIFFFVKLKESGTSQFSVLWKWFFFFFAFSFFGGGLAHAAYNYMGQTGKIPGWIAGILGVTFVELAMISSLDDKRKKSFTFIIFSKLAIVGVLMIYTQSFSYVIIHTAGMAAFIFALGLSSRIRGENQYKWIMLGVVGLLMALPVKLMGLDLHLWFNRDDLSHVFMIFTLWFYYMGVREYDRAQVELSTERV